jgi:RNA polymerase sigma-70 factor (ECF subfamily)
MEPTVPPAPGPAAAAPALTAVGVSPTATAAARLQAVLEGHFRLVWRTLRGFGVAAGEVDDAAQEVFLTLHRRLADVVPGYERPFLVQTALRVAANRRRGRQRRREVLADDIAAFVSDLPDPEALYVVRERRARVERALDELPDDQRTVFVLFELEGFSRREISELLLLPPGTVASRLRRARDRFQELIGVALPVAPAEGRP